MLYVHKGIKLHQISKYPRDINVIISKNNAQFSIVGLYKSPTTPMVELVSSMEAILSNCDHLPLTSIGNFNLDASNGVNKTFCDIMKSKYNCNQYVTPPATNDQTTTDHIFFSNYPHQNTFTIDCYWSDHKLLCTVMDTTLKQYKF